MSIPESDPQPVIGHHSAWGLGSHSRVEPYRLTPGAIDTMCVRVREKIDVSGVGTDVVEMQGSFTVRRDHPCAVDEAGDIEWGRSCVKTEFRALELSGESPVFGTVRVHLDPEHSSFGEVGPAQEGSLAASCVAHCYPVVELPELGMRLTTGGQAVDLASKVIQIPPVGDVARSENSASLLDDHGNTVGEIISSDIEVGEVVCSFALGNTAPRGQQAVHVHEIDGHHEPSGPGFFAQPPSEGPAAPSHGGRPASSSSTAATPPQATGGVQDVLARLERDLGDLVEQMRGMSGTGDAPAGR